MRESTRVAGGRKPRRTVVSLVFALVFGVMGVVPPPALAEHLDYQIGEASDNDATRRVALNMEVDAPFDGATFNISFTCDDGSSATNPSAGNGETTIASDVAVGAVCTATQINPGVDWSVELPDDLTITAAGPNAFTIKNTYSATRRVALNMEVDAPFDGATFNISFTCDDGSSATNPSAGNGDTTIASDVAVGAVCTATQINPGPDWSVELPDDLTVTAAGPNEFTIKNTYSATRRVALNMEVDADAPFDGATFNISFTCDDGTDIVTSGSVTVGDGDIAAINDVLVGWSCTATESNIPANWTVSYSPSQTITVTAAGPNVITIVNTYVPPPPAGQGCTPGYWKNHFDRWPANWSHYDAQFEAVYDYSLIEAIQLMGGGGKALARHAAAGLLNAFTGGVDYQLDSGTILAGGYAKDVLEFNNDLGCPLGGTSASPVPTPRQVDAAAEEAAAEEDTSVDDTAEGEHAEEEAALVIEVPEAESAEEEPTEESSAGRVVDPPVDEAPVEQETPADDAPGKSDNTWGKNKGKAKGNKGK